MDDLTAAIEAVVGRCVEKYIGVPDVDVGDTGRHEAATATEAATANKAVAATIHTRPLGGGSGVDIVRHLTSYIYERTCQIKRLSDDVISISSLLEIEEERTKKLQSELAAERKRVGELHAMLRAEEQAVKERVGKLQNALDRERALARNRALPHAKVVEAGRKRNTELASLFRELSSYYTYECQKDAYELVAQRLEDHYCEVTSGMQALSIQDIGNSSARKIQEWLDTGSIALLENFRKTAAEEGWED